MVGRVYRVWVIHQPVVGKTPFQENKENKRADLDKVTFDITETIYAHLIIKMTLYF